ncbi:hypothetical protein IC617_09780 [Neiella sp. HB171785]|uniref:KfrA N-terminal DNA-binding domain-containing protein n=1 Tax=Neiella litorisoli TaxID=2771431 RepID=A0A8J6QS54_9GAMM|nr:hypothetical protein [Neiella litorisoli]MBD1389719.1 hypothetical protein [Neiella litorisoli]
MPDYQAIVDQAVAHIRAQHQEPTVARVKRHLSHPVPLAILMPAVKAAQQSGDSAASARKVVAQASESPELEAMTTEQLSQAVRQLQQQVLSLQQQINELRGS